MISRTIRVLLAACCALGASTAIGSTTDSRHDIEKHVDAAVQVVMAKYHIPGMAVGVIVDGNAYVFDYGVASTATRQPVMRDTLFEIGSISKTFTATLASYAQVSGQLSLSDETGKYLPSLRDSKFGNVSLLDLGTHTPGGLPLQVPDDLHNDQQLLEYLREWQPASAPGTYRTYSNIGTLGLITAKSMGQDFTTMLQQHVFSGLRLRSTYLEVPANKMADYAQGYTTAGAPIRMAPGVLGPEAYGIRTTASDLLRFVQANMGLINLNVNLQRAITATHIGYFQAGVMTQDLIWEQFPYPVTLQTLLAGNAPAMIFNATPVTRMLPPQKARGDVWINKTGSTSGFSAYVAFIPEQRLGIVILANRSFPIADRVTAAYRILTALDDDER